jgi:hypothetical protein
MDWTSHFSRGDARGDGGRQGKTFAGFSLFLGVCVCGSFGEQEARAGRQEKTMIRAGFGI